MNITVIGAGYVGLVSGVCYAELGNNVCCVDKDERKVTMLNRGEIPIYEPGLQELAVRNMQAERLRFTDNLAEAVQETEVIVIAVGTPSLPNGEADMQYIKGVAQEIADHLGGYAVIAIKSTVPVGTNEQVHRIIRSRTAVPFDIASVPEFLREGSAVYDTLHPDRIVIGADSERAKQILVRLHRPLTDQLALTDIRSSEMIKYASNAFLATKISFINEIANICEKVGADVTKVAQGMGLDHRIGSSFLRAGIGYGGSCFPKDTKALIQIAGNVKYDFKLLKSVVEVNQHQRYGVIDKLEIALGTLRGKLIGVWGLAFKPETDDVRETPALEIIETLIKRGAIPKVYDPIAMNNFQAIFDDPVIQWCSSALDTASECDAICLLTEWREFIDVDLRQVEQTMAMPVMIDGRNVFSADQIAETNFAYYPVGRPGMNIPNPTIYEVVKNG